MSKKNKDEGSSNNFLAGLIGVGLGVLGGFLISKLVNDKE
jgi:hypothetical protein